MTDSVQVREIATRSRELVAASLDVEAGLVNLRATARRRRRVQALAVAAATAAVVVGTSVVLPTGRDSVRPVDESPADSATVDVPRSDAPNSCCDGTRSLELALGALTLRVELPEEFSTDIDLNDGLPAVDLVQDEPGTNAAVTLMLGVSPATTFGEVTHMDTAELAQWVADRRFLATSGPSRSTLSGFPAWTVSTRLAPGHAAPNGGPDTCNNGFQPGCRPVLMQMRPSGAWETGVWENMVGSFTFVDVPGDDVLVVWSWAIKPVSDALAANDRLRRQLAIERRSP